MVFLILEIVGVLTAALSGIIEARQRGMDMIGIYTVAFITAFGGGTLRDLLLDRTPLFWVAHEEYAIIILILALISIFFTPFSIKSNYFNIPDALGLGFFSVLGSALALESGTTMFIASLMGVITGTFGGVCRDIVCNEVPFLFRNNHLYATCSFLGCWVYLLLNFSGFNTGISTSIAILFIFTFRLIAVKYNIRLPEGKK